MVERCTAEIPTVTKRGELIAAAYQGSLGMAKRRVADQAIAVTARRFAIPPPH
jgi:hypothetical protein